MGAALQSCRCVGRVSPLSLDHIARQSGEFGDLIVEWSLSVAKLPSVSVILVIFVGSR